jgi:basic membrane protein A and related proteins
MKSLRIGAVLATAGLLFAACGDDSSSTTSSDASGTTAAGSETTVAATATTAAATEVDCSTAESFCVGLVTDLGKVDDKSFNQSSWEGTKEGAEAVGGAADYIESTTQTDYANNIKSFTDKKYKVIVTVGFALGADTAKAAKANPTVKFIGVDQFPGEALDNYTGLIFNEDKAGFMAGALAGLLTKTNIVGAVVGTDTVPPVVAFTNGWENGAKYTNPKVKTISTYHPAGDNAFNDPDWGASTAKQALDQGADVIFGAGGNTGNGALNEVAKKAGAFCVGVDTDQWETLPTAHACLVTSAEKELKKGTIELIKQAKDGTIKGGPFVGTTKISPYHDFDSTISAEAKAKVDTIVKGVLDGSIPTGYKAA